MTLPVQQNSYSHLSQHVANRSPYFILASTLYLLLVLGGLSACNGSAVFANEPEPKVLPPTTVTQPPAEEPSAEDVEAGDASAEATTPRAVPTVQSPLEVPLLAGAGTAQDNDLVASRSCNDAPLSINATVNIGVLAPLSESVAEQAGLSMVSSANLARGDIESEGGILGRKVNLVTGDTQGDPAIAREVAIEMITQQCVVGLVGVYHSSVGLEIKDVAREFGIPVIFAEPSSDEILADRYDEVFRIGPSSRMVNLGFARWVRNIGDFNDDGTTLVSIIAENNAGSINRVESFTDVLGSYGLEVKPLLVDPNGVDFSSVIARLVAGSNLPDFVFVWVNGDSGYALLRELNNAAIGPANRTVVVARQTALEDGRFWQELPNGEQTVVSKIGPWHSTITPMGRDFVDRYQTLYGYWPESYAFASYDAVWLMADAINRAGSTVKRAIINSLEESDVELASGRYCFPKASDTAFATSDDAELVVSCGSPNGTIWHQWPHSPILFLQYTEANQSAAEMTTIWPHSFQNSISTTLTAD